MLNVLVRIAYKIFTRWWRVHCWIVLALGTVFIL